MVRMTSLLLLATATLVAGCGKPPATTVLPPETAFTADTLRLALETAQPGDVIAVPEGRFDFRRGLTLIADGVTIRGAGMDATTLRFANQVAGAEGMLVTGSDFTIEDLAIEDTAGDALKINGGRNIVVRRVRTEWTNGPDTGNGAYGIYPVQTENTLVEESVAIGASDAGIYVGQSRNVIVRHSRAEWNVAGIEIENTVGADVYGNVATRNTGGILVFNMPDLPQTGHSTRVFDNDVLDNSTANFAAPGSAVASVPAGSGVIVSANDRVEIFDNRIAGHRTGNVLISSYFSAGYSGERDMQPTFDPYPETLFVYGNTFGRGGHAPDLAALDAVRTALYGDTGSLPDIVWDGFRNPEKTAAEYAICVDNAGAAVLDLDADDDYASPAVDPGAHDCAHEKLAPVTFAGL